MLEEIIGEKRFPLWGIIASIIGIVFILAPMVPYQGTEGEVFSIFNHYVSELGELGVSEWALVFNIGLILAGAVYIPFFIGLGLYLDSKLSKIGASVGVYSAISIILVGIYPMNYIAEHYLTATSFFLSGMVMVFLWALAIFLQKEERIPKVFSIGGLFNGIIFVAFLSWRESDGSGRPDFSIASTLEWAIYFAIVGYLLSIALYIYFIDKKRI